MSAKRRRQWVERTALLLALKEEVGWRCEHCHLLVPLDGHEIRKPRSRYWLDREYVILLCRACHERAEASYRQGRLVIVGTRSEGWDMSMVFTDDKWAAREAGVA